MNSGYRLSFVAGSFGTPGLTVLKTEEIRFSGLCFQFFVHIYDLQ